MWNSFYVKKAGQIRTVLVGEQTMVSVTTAQNNPTEWQAEGGYK